MRPSPRTIAFVKFRGPCQDDLRLAINVLNEEEARLDEPVLKPLPWRDGQVDDVVLSKLLHKGVGWIPVQFKGKPPCFSCSGCHVWILCTNSIDLEPMFLHVFTESIEHLEVPMLLMVSHRFL